MLEGWSVLRRPAVLALILVNFIPLWGVIFRGWDVANILHLYWAENLAFGFITLLRLLTNRHESARAAQKIAMSLFFCVHYGFFCYGHAGFVFGDFLREGGGNAGSSLVPALEGALNFLQQQQLLVAGFLGIHLVSFFSNYHGRGEAQRLTLGKVMFLPYRRIVILHVTIVFGGMAVLSAGSPVWLILVLVLAKTGGDLILHIREHQERE